MKHTPGPWIDRDGQIYPEETGKTLAIIPYFDKENEEHEANARLIAAAPDLLEQLQNIIFAFSSSAQSDIQKAAIKYANDAILKATK